MASLKYRLDGIKPNILLFNFYILILHKALLYIHTCILCNKMWMCWYLIAALRIVYSLINNQTSLISMFSIQFGTIVSVDWCKDRKKHRKKSNWMHYTRKCHFPINLPKKRFCMLQNYTIPIFPFVYKFGPVLFNDLIGLRSGIKSANCMTLIIMSTYWFCVGNILKMALFLLFETLNHMNELKIKEWSFNCQ